MGEPELQIDHRIPYEVAGDVKNADPDEFMLLSLSANRAKSWSCEHCENWQNQKNIEICLTCYWAYPENYSHVAMRQIRRVDLLWQDKQVHQYEQLKRDANESGLTIPEFIKEIIEKAIKSKQ